MRRLHQIVIIISIIIGLDTVCRIMLIKDVLLMSVRLDIKIFSQSL